MPTPFVRSSQIRFVVSNSSYSSIFGLTKSTKVLHVLLESFVGFILQAADAEGMRGQPCAAIFLENLENLFPVAEGIKKRRDRADIERMRSQPKLVAGDPVQFRENDADYCARGGASTFSSFSTVSQYPSPFETAAT